MRHLNGIYVLGISLVLIGCKTGAVRNEVPAYIVDSTAESRAELRLVVSSMLGGRAVTIADDALTTQSMLVIEPTNLTGRDLGKPDQFRLVLSDSSCVLVHLGTEERSKLTKTNCAAE